MTRIPRVKVRLGPCGAILRQITASKGSKGIEVRERGERRASGRASGSDKERPRYRSGKNETRKRGREQRVVSAM